MILEHRHCGFCDRDASSVEVPRTVGGTAFNGWDTVTINGAKIDRCAVCAFTLDLPLSSRSNRDPVREG